MTSAGPDTSAFRDKVLKRPDSWWTVLVIDPIALVVLKRLAPYPAVTPFRLTAFSAVLGVAAASFFATGHLLLGAVSYEARFFFDCLDGKLARLRGIASPRGAFFDLACDVVLISSILAGFGWHLVERRAVPLALILVVLCLCLVMFWLILYRQMQQRAVVAPSAPLEPPTSRRRRDRAGDWFLRHRLARSVRTVEIETLVLFVAPLSGHVGLIVTSLVIAALFYLLACIRLFLRVYEDLPTRHGSA